jgi:ribonuclease HII
VARISRRRRNRLAYNSGLMHSDGASREAALVCGVDEAGRGPLAGPVVAAAVVMASGQSIDGVRDSKQLSPARRELLAVQIRQHAAAWAVGLASPAEIDDINILQATLLAMSRAIRALTVRPGWIQVDGNTLPDLPEFAAGMEAVVGGDRQCQVISAASILAKVHRDELMCALDRGFPGYGFAVHKGYPTPAHLAALEQLGPSPVHRHSFAPVRAVAGAR